MTANPAPVFSTRHLREAKNNIDWWTQDADQLAHDGDYVALGDGLDRLRALRRQLSTLERHCEDLLAPILPEKRTIVPGVLGMERRSSTIRKPWQSEQILDELWRGAVADENGVIDVQGQSERFLTAVKTCIPLTASLGWRVKALIGYGLDPDEWCEATPGRATVQTWRPEEYDDA